WVVIFFVRRIFSIRVSDLCAEVVDFSGHIIADPFGKCELKIGIDVHLDYTVTDGLADFLNSRTRSSVEYEVNWVFTGIEFILDVILRVFQDNRCQFYIARLVYAVNVSESG